MPRPCWGWLARALELRTVAEEVKPDRGRPWLTQHSCDIAQGYFFSKPLEAEYFEVTIARHAIHG